MNIYTFIAYPPVMIANADGIIPRIWPSAVNHTVFA